MHAKPASTEVGLEQALELLKGPSDERRLESLLAELQGVVASGHSRYHSDSLCVLGLHCRFVGLLLVSKFVAPGNHEHIQQVQEAVGFTFLQRLLMPLRAQHAVRRLMTFCLFCLF